MNIAEEFTHHIYQRRPYHWSDRLQNAYDEIIAWMKTEPHMKGFDKGDNKPLLNYDSPYDVARHFFWYFQPHYTKVYHSLLKMSDETVKSGEISWLDEPNLCIIDIGAGTGAATLALLELLCDYHDYRWQKGYVTWPRTVTIVAVDPSQEALNLFQRFQNLLSTQWKEFAQIDVEINFIKEKFPHPKCLGSLKQSWKPKHRYTLITILSNVISPTQQWIDEINSLLSWGDDIKSKLDLGEIEAKMYKELLEHYKFNRVLSLEIVTKGSTLIDWLRQKSKSLLQWFDKSGKKPSSFEFKRPKEEQLQIEIQNAPNTYWGQKKPDYTCPIKYSHQIRYGSICSIDLPWTKTLDGKNLEMAWVRTRNYILYDDFIDEVEIRLVDFAWQTYLDRLRNYLMTSQYEVLNLDHSVFYLAPKNSKGDRPRYLLRLGEQIISAALSQANSHSFEPFYPEHVLGNRLNKDNNEFFYESWFEQFNAYSQAITKVVSENQNESVYKLDVKSFYTSIMQEKLCNSLCHGIQLTEDSDLRKVISYLVMRPLDNTYHKPNHGLPQSGIAAGLWASNYLREVDSAILHDNTSLVKFYRYADDMTIVAPSEVGSGQIEVISQAIKSLGLELNADKTEYEQSISYLKKNSPEPRYEKLSKKIRVLMNSLYYIPQKYKKAKSLNRNLFLYEYEQLLRRIKIFLPDFPNWLNRKISQRLSWSYWYNWKHKLKGGLMVKFPRYHLGMSQKDQDQWCKDFQLMNSRWLQERENIVSELVQFFQDGLSSLDDAGGKLDQRTRSTQRFSARHLSLFGVSPIAESLEKIIENDPWQLSPKIILKAMVDDGLSMTVLRLAKDWHNRKIPKQNGTVVLKCAPQLCASACRALSYGNLTADIEKFIWSVLFSNVSQLEEKLASSEALLRLKISRIDKYDSTIKFFKLRFLLASGVQ
jgi:hypothetical protein